MVTCNPPVVSELTTPFHNTSFPALLHSVYLYWLSDHFVDGDFY